jgi:2,4-dienoyl-CoA reductase-like NADH-dependent reductase (Old Yellow Enzyme family)
VSTASYDAPTVPYDEDGAPDLDFSPMFAPVTVRGMTLTNRFVLPAMQRKWCVNGEPMPQLIEYYRRRVLGGSALVITEACAVDHPTATQVPHYGWISEATRDAWADGVRRVRSAGGHMFVQLFHEGACRSEGGDGPLSEHPTLSPSGLEHPDMPKGRAATGQELEEIKDAFVRGARITKEIGASGVEVHACHGYLLDQFLWAGTNRRTDGYGGPDIRDRVRFPAEIVAAIRDAVGPDFPISLRFSQWKEIDYGARIAETPRELELMLGILRYAGVDMFHASARRFWIPEWPGSDLGIAGWTKKLTDAVVVGVGSVGYDLDVMESLRTQKEANSTGRAGLAELLRRFTAGEFDLMSVGRGQIADAEWVHKVRDGRFSDLCPFVRADVRSQAEP